MTAAERQSRHRKKQRREVKAAEAAAKREANQERFRRSVRDDDRSWTQACSRPAIPPLENKADEIALQVAQALWEREGEIDIDDVRDAIDRRFGPRGEPKADDMTDAEARLAFDAFLTALKSMPAPIRPGKGKLDII